MLNQQSRAGRVTTTSLFRLSYTSLLSNPKNDQNLNKQLPSHVTSLTKSNNNYIFNSIRINQIFQQLNISDKIIKQICTEVNINRIRQTCKINYKDNEILLIIEGQMYQYNCTEIDNNKNQASRTEYILIRKLHKNQYFHNYIGESKIQNQLKSRIIAQKGTVYIRIHQKSFRKYFVKKLEVSLLDRLNLIKKSEILRDLRKFLLLNIANHLEIHMLAANKIIYNAGEKSDYLYFVKKGNILMSESNQNQKIKNEIIVQSQNLFGLDGIFVNIQNQLRLYNAKTITQVELYRINKRTLVNLVTSTMRSIKQQQDTNINQEVINKDINKNINSGVQYKQNRMKMNTSQRKIRNLRLFQNIRKHNEEQIFQNDEGTRLNQKLKNQKNIFNNTYKSNFNQPNIPSNKLNIIIMNPIQQFFDYSNSNEFGLTKTKFFKSNTVQQLKKEVIKTNREKQKIIFENLQKRRSNQMLFKLKQVYFNKQEERYSQMIKIKRLFKLNRKKIHSQLERQREKQKYTPSPKKYYQNIPPILVLTPPIK